MYKKAGKKNETYKRHCELWSKEEDYKLEQLVLQNKPMLEIITEHQRSEGSIKFRIRGIAYEYYQKNKNKTNLSREEFIEEVENMFHLTDFLTFVQDREKYLKDKEERDYEKNKEIARMKEEKEKERRIEKERIREEKKNKAEEARILKEKAEILKKEQKEKEQALKLELKLEKERIEKENKQTLKLEQEKAKRDREAAKEASINKEYNYIYCLMEREFIKTGEMIYKVGKTTVNPTKRLSQYPNDSDLILLVKVENCHIFEKELLKILDKKFKRAYSIGREYYHVENQKDIVMEIINLIN